MHFIATCHEKETRKTEVIRVFLVSFCFISHRNHRIMGPPPTQPPSQMGGFAPLCGAAATPVAALKTPVAKKRGATKGTQNQHKISTYHTYFHGLLVEHLKTRKERIFLKKTEKTPLVSAAVFDLTCCSSVLCLKASFCTVHKYITVLCQNSAATAEKTKKSPICAARNFYCFFQEKR